MASEPYDVGTVSVANGSVTVTGTDTFWIGKVRKNEMFMDPASGLQARVTADPVLNGELTINAWPGPALVDAAYEIIPAADSTTSAARLRDLLAQMSVVEANGRGLFFRFSDQTDDADPGAGYVRINDPAIASSTGGYFDNLDAEGASVAPELDTWDDSTSLVRGKLWLRSLTEPSTFHALAVTDAVVDGTGYRKLTWSYIGGSGSFAADEEMMAFFAPKGDRGDGYVTDADVADPSELTPYESEAAGFLVFVTDLGTDFGAYSGRSGVVRLVAGPAWELAALYTGPQGAASTVPGPTGPVGIDWKGPYSAGTAYELNDGVLDNGSSWRALGPTTGNAPPVLPTTSNVFWELIARAGTDGSGTGDMVGPASSVNARIAVYDGTSGKLLKDGGKTIDELVPANDSITNAILANMATARIKGRATAGTGDPEDLTAAQVLTLLKAVGAFARDNILGTVGLSGGVPTGGVLEYGTNANGKYLRFADGTQIVFGNRTAFSSGTSIALPAAFSDTNYYPIANLHVSTGGSGANAYGLFPDSFSVAHAAAGASTISFIAIGRWN